MPPLAGLQVVAVIRQSFAERLPGRAYFAYFWDGRLEDRLQTMGSAAAPRGFGVGTVVAREGAGFCHGGGGSDILTQAAAPPNSYISSRFGSNDLSRNSHPFTEYRGCQDPQHHH